jgi:hypothetical protein
VEPEKQVENADLTGAKARAVLRIVDCLIFLWEHRLDAGCLKDFPAPAMWFDFNQCHPARFFPVQETLSFSSALND